MSNFKPGGANSIHHPWAFGKEKVKYTFGLLGAPFEKGQDKKGVDEFPETFRSLGLIKQLQDSGIDVKDWGDANCLGVSSLPHKTFKIHNLEDVSAFTKERSYKSSEHYAPKSLTKSPAPFSHRGVQLMFVCHVMIVITLLQVSSNVQDILSEGRVSVTLGGDHSISIGTIDAHMKSRGPVAVIWVDAHGDINTPDTSPSGNIHGMPLAVLSKELVDYWPDLPVFSWLNRRYTLTADVSRVSGYTETAPKCLVVKDLIMLPVSRSPISNGKHRSVWTHAQVSPDNF
ncbi:unnamed protein product, partial [Timema podura]|nr:unnamed protein product [Timema podura]